MRDMEDRPGRRRLDHDQEPTVGREEEDGATPFEDEESDGEFEFPSVSQDSSAASGGGGGAAAADDLFAGGRIRAFYPVFGRVLDEASAASAPSPSRAPLGRLFKLEQARASSVASTSSSSSSASTADAGLDSASPDTYCLWTPGSSPASSPLRPPTRKSGSTGSSVPRWRRIGELVVGGSRSDGKDRFLFLSAPSSPARDSKAAKQAPPKGGGAKAGSGTELDTVAAGRRMSYGGGGAAKASPGGRRTFLPYRQDLVGLFASVHGLSRSPNPF